MKQFFFYAIYAATMTHASQKELARLDADIRRLKELEVHYRMQAAIHEDEGTRWEVFPERVAESERAFKEADRDKEMEKRIEARIRHLEAKRSALEHGETLS